MTSAEETKLPGFKFILDEKELVDDYLPHKVWGNESLVSEIAEIHNILKYEPWDLPRMAVYPSEDQWYFFSPRNSERSKRITKAGFWKVTGSAKDKVIKRYLVFYLGRSSKPVWTPFAIHEYYLKPSNSNGRGYVISVLLRKPSPKKIVDSTFGEGETGHDSASEVEDPFTDLPDIDRHVMEFMDSDEQDLCSPTLQQPDMQGTSNVYLQNTKVPSDDYTMPFSQRGSGDQFSEAVKSPIQDVFYSGSMRTTLDDFSLSESVGSLHTEAGIARVDCCLPEMYTMQGLSNENLQQANGVNDEYSPSESVGSLHVKDISDAYTEFNCHIETTPGGGSVCFCDRCLYLFLHVFPRQENSEK